MMSDHHRRRSPESSRRRRKSRRDSREQLNGDESTISRSAFSTTADGLASSYYPTQQSQFGSVSASASVPVDARPIAMHSTEPSPRAPSAVPIPSDLNRPRRVRRHGSRSSLDSSGSSSFSASSSSSYLDISRWYPSWGRAGGVLKTFFKTPSEHRPRRRRSQRSMHKKKTIKGASVFGSKNSSSSSVNSDMAYGMGFVKKHKSREGGYSRSIVPGTAASVSERRERSDARPGLQRRQTDEEIREIGRKLQDVARMQNRADLDRHGKTAWESYQRQSGSGVEASSRGLGSSRHARRHRHASSSDDEWESASEGEDSDELSGLAYGHTPIPTPRPTKSSVSRMGTASAIAAGSALVAGSAIAAATAHDRKSAVVDPKLFGPTNSLRDFVHTPCGFNDDGGASTFTGPGSEGQGYAGSAESASAESRPLQRLFPLQTSNPGHVEAARASGSVVSSQQNYSSLLRERVYTNTSQSNRPEPVPIQAPKPIAPVPSRIYDDERIRDIVPADPVQHHGRKPTSDNKIYAETALVGAGVAALGAAILAGRDKGAGKESDDPELTHGKHERYGHDDHRQDDTKVEDARKAQELRLMQEIERLETALGRTNKAREQRRRDSKRDKDSISRLDDPADGSRRAGEVGVHSERSALVEDDNHNRHVDDPSQPTASTPFDVFQFQVPDDAFTTGHSPPKAPSPYIIDVTPSPSPAPEESRDSRRGSLAEETRDAHRIYEEAHHSTAPIPEAVMAAAIGAVVHSRRHQDGEQGRGRSNTRTADTIQEEANKVYAARRAAERELRSRSRSKVYDDPVEEVPRIVTPPEMHNRPPKNPFSGENADFRLDMEMSPAQLLGYWPKVAPIRDASAERPRPVLNLVTPTPVPTPDPERQRSATVNEPEPEPEPVEAGQKEMPSVVLGPRGDVIEVVEVVEEPPTAPTSKRVSWGPSQTKQYEEHSPERSHEHSPPTGKPKSGFGGWGAIAAAMTGAGVGAALAHDIEPKSPRRGERSREERPSGSRSPPKERPVLPTGMSSHVIGEEPEELPPAPGPKPASPRNSQQMPGAFSDDIDFVATLAAGLEHSGFDPEIVIDNPEYHRRDSPPGSNEPYTQPYAETVSDLGMYNVDDSYNPLFQEHGYVIGEVGTPSSEKEAPLLKDFADVTVGGSRRDQRQSSIYDDIEVTEEPYTPESDIAKLSKKERRKLEKAAQAAKIAEEEAQAAHPEAVEAGEGAWDDAPTSKKTKKSKKAKRSSVAWDDADTPINDTGVVNAFSDIKDTRSVDDVDDWDTQKRSKKSKRDSKGYEPRGDDRPDKEKRDRRSTEFYDPVDRDVISVGSDSRVDDNGDDDRSVASATSGSKRDSKRSSGGFWGLLGGREQQQHQSKKDNAGTLGAGAGLAGVAAVGMAAAVAGSDAAEAPMGNKQREPQSGREVEEVEVFEDPEIAPRVIKPAIDPQYGDLLPLPPSPGESLVEFDDEEALPALPDSRPITPPGQAPVVFRERDTSMKRPHFAGHVRRTSNAEAPPRSPSHTAIPIQFRMGHRSLPATSPAMASRSSPVVQSPTTPAQESPPMFKRSEFSPTFKRQPSRPTSWDNSREIKPLYLLERSARPASEAEERNETAEMTPLPASRESSVFDEDELEREEPVGLGVAAGPLAVDTDIARSVDHGSQEPTPTGLKPAEQSFNLAQDVETTPLGFPSSSSLPDSSYATPAEFPRDTETTVSPKLEPLQSQAPIDNKRVVEKRETKSYFPSALSILPAATLAGVGVLLGRGKKDETRENADDRHGKMVGDRSLPPATESPTGTALELPTQSTLESVAKSDSAQHVPESSLDEVVDLQSPADFQDAQAELPTTATADKSIRPQGLPISDGADLNTVDEPPNLAAGAMASTAPQQSGSDSPKTIVAKQDILGQSPPSQSDVVDAAAERQREDSRPQGPRDDMNPSFSEMLHDISVSQFESTSGDALTQTMGQEDAAGTTAAVEQPNKPQSEAEGNASDNPNPPIGSSQTYSTDMITDPIPTETQAAEDEWAPSSSRKRKNKKKNNKQSISFAEDVTDNLVPTASDNKDIGSAQKLDLQQDYATAMGLAQTPSKYWKEPLDTSAQPLDPVAVHDDIPQQSQMSPRNTTEESSVIESRGTQLDLPSRDIEAGEVPTLLNEQAEDSQLDVRQFLVDEPVATPSEQQGFQEDEPDSFLVPEEEEEFPLISQKVQKNKKRQGSKSVDEAHHSSAITASEDRDSFELPVHLPEQATSAADVDNEPVNLPSESIQVPTVLENGATIGREAARSSSPADETVKSIEAPEDESLPMQRDIEPESQKLEHHESATSPKSTPRDSVSEIISEQVEPTGSSLEHTQGKDVSESLQPAISSSAERMQRSGILTELTALDNAPSDLDISSVQPQDLQTLDAAEDTGREVDSSILVAEQNDPQQLEDLDKPFDEEEAARREAEAAQIQEEQAEVARLQLKRKPSKKDKTRLRDLKARAQQRAAEAEVVTPSSRSPKELERPALEPEVAQPSSHIAETQSVETILAEDPILAQQSDQAANKAESQESGPLWNTSRPAEQDTENFQSADEGAHAASRFEPQQLEDSEEMARREAEVERIRDEESELARLKIKRKPSKKDKSRIKALEANAEDREREAAAIRDLQSEAPAHVDVGQGVATGPAEETSQPPTGSNALEDVRQPRSDTSTELASEDKNVSELGSIAQSLMEMRVLDRPVTHKTQDIDDPPLVSNEHGHVEEHHVGVGHESAIQGHAARSSQETIDIPPSTLGQTIGVSQGRSEGITKDINQLSSSSLDKTKNKFGGWGVIAAAVTGAGIGAALGKDDQPEQLQESQILSKETIAEANDETTHLESYSRDIEEDGSRPKLQDENQSHTEVQEAGSHEDTFSTDVVEPSSLRFEEPDSTVKFGQPDKDTTSIAANLDPEKTATTEFQPDSEWSLPSEKSKKDKKKKRKGGALSADSGQSSGLATLLETSEPVSIPKTAADKDDVDARISREEDLLPVVDRELASVQQTETPLVAQHDPAFAISPWDVMARDVASSNLTEAIAGTQEDTSSRVEDSAHQPAVDIAQSASAVGVGSASPRSENRVSLEELMDLPASLVRSVEAVPSTAEPVHPATEQGSVHTKQDLSQEIQHHGNGPHQLSSPDGVVSAATAAAVIQANEQDTVPAVEMSQDLPTETEPDTSIADESQQLQDDDFSWAPSKKRDKKKKKRQSVAWSELVSGSQTPIDEEVSEHSTRDVFQETSNPTPYLPQDEGLTEARDLRPQLDDWYPITTSEKETPSNDEPHEIHEVVRELTGNSGDGENATLHQESDLVPDPDLMAYQDDGSRPAENESIDELPSETNRNPGALENASSDDPDSKQHLESKIDGGKDTLIVADGNMSDADIALADETPASQRPLDTSPPAKMIEDPHPNEAISESARDIQIKHVDDPITAAGGEGADQEDLLATDHRVDLSPYNEHMPETDSFGTIDDEQDTSVVTGGKVDDEVSEPRAFEAAHDSPTITKSHSDIESQDGEDALIVVSGKHDDFNRPSQFRDDSQDDGQRTMEPENEFLDANRSTSRPHSPAPWGDEDYSAFRQHTDLQAGHPVARSTSPDPQEEDEAHTAGHHVDFSGIQRLDPRLDSPVPSDDNNSAFVTPFEDAPVLAAEPDSIFISDIRQDEEEPSEWAPIKRSKKGKKNKKNASISQSPEIAPEPSDPVLEAPQFEENLQQRSVEESIESYGGNDTVIDEALEPKNELLDDLAPRKLTKKEKRKAKKASMSNPDPEVSAESLEDSPVEEPFSRSQYQMPAFDATAGDVQHEDSSRSESGHLEQPAEEVEPTEQPFDVQSSPTHRLESTKSELPEESAEAVEPDGGETSVDRQTAPSSPALGEAAVTAAAAAVSVPVLTRKMSKKEKRRAKKASALWEDDASETRQPQTLAVDNIHSQEAPAVARPIEDVHLTREVNLERSPPRSHTDQEVPANLDTSSAVDATVDNDEWAVPLSRKKSKGKKKQITLDSASASASDTQTPTTAESHSLASAEAARLPTPTERTVEESLPPTAEDVNVPTSPLWPPPAETSEASSGAHLEAESPAKLGDDLKNMPSAAPSPDPWESEDYFKPKSPGGSPTDPPEEPFENLEIHPAFTRGLNTTPDYRSRDERPLVGLGLIHRHSSIFHEDDGHTPKLLTLTSDNVSVESLAIEEASQAGASAETHRVSESGDGSKSREQSDDAALNGSRPSNTLNTSLEKQADMSPIPEPVVPSSSAHPQRRFPLSPRLSPRPAPEDPPKSPIPDEISLSQRGSVAMLAQRFGGKRKKVSKYVDKRARAQEDLFDDPAMWEGAEPKVVEGSRMDEDAGNFWAVEDANFDDETSEPDVHPGQGSTPPAPDRGTQHGDDNVSATHSPTGSGAGRFTPELSEKTARKEEVPLEPMVESPILGSQASIGSYSPEPQRTLQSPSSPMDAEANQTEHRPMNIAETWDLIGARHQRDDPPSALSGSPVSNRSVGLEASVLPSLETDHDQSRESFIPTVDFRRSVSRGLPPVQEEPLEEEVGSGNYATTLAVTTPDINRDSGLVTDSPRQAWTRRFDDAQQRDSGVHMRDDRDRSPGLHSSHRSRDGSPDPNRVPRSSGEDEGGRLDEMPKRSPLAKYESRFREDTPVLEAQEPPVTPEPQKLRNSQSRSHHKYPDLGPGATPATALAGGAVLLAAQESVGRSPSLSPAEGQRSVSDNSAERMRASASPLPVTPASQRRAVSNTRLSRARTPEPLNLGPESPSLLMHSGTPPLRSRRTRSGDLRTLSQSSNQSHSDLGAGVGTSPSPVNRPTPTPAAAAANTPVPASSSSSSDLRKATKPAAAPTSTANPVANEGRVRSKDMADVYDGFGEGRMGSPRSPTRPHSMRRRQSMQVLDLENRVEQLMAENRALAEAKTQAELRSTNQATSSLAERDNEIEALKQSLEFMRREIHRLTEVNEGLNSAISQSAVQHQDRYRLLETQHAAIAGELDNFRSQHGSHAQTIEAKDAEIRSLREQLEATKEQIREMQRQILATNPADSDILRTKDVDYFDHRCQQLCSHVQQWVLRFSKFSDMRACRLTAELNDEKIIDRLDNAILDGSNVDSYLNDRVRRRDVFMSVVMTMIWDFVFTRYLFGMDREQRQKLKVLEKLLLEVGPPKAVRQWRAVTLTLLSKRDAFKDQREQDTEAVVQAVFQTLSMILPPPSNLEDQIQGQLRKVMREAVELSIEMRTQRAEYMMLPPLQPEYDASGDLAEPQLFNAQLMSERSGDKSNDDDLQAEGAILRVVLFPLVVKKGDDDGVGDDEVVVCPAQVIVKKPRSSSRRSMRAPSSDAGGVSLLRGGSPSTAPNRSNVSMAEAEYIEGGI